MAVGSATLKDGTPIIVRPVAVSDRHLLEEGWPRLSERSRYQRFFRVIERLRDEELDFFVNVDHDEHEAVGALAEDGSTGWESPATSGWRRTRPQPRSRSSSPTTPRARGSAASSWRRWPSALERTACSASSP
jgi:hypothetical protein